MTTEQIPEFEKQLSASSFMKADRLRIMVIRNRYYADGSMTASGGIMREDNLLKMLERYYDIRVFSPETGEVPKNRFLRIFSTFTSAPWSARADSKVRKTNNRKLDAEIKTFRPNLILVFYPTMLTWVSVKYRIPVILDAYDIMWIVEKRLQELKGISNGLRARSRIIGIRHHEKQNYNLVDEVWACSEQDMDTIHSMNYQGKVRVIPNFHITNSSNKPNYHKPSNTILFVGYMPYKPNKSGMSWFLKNCWQTILDRVPDARCIVVGKWGEREPDIEFKQSGVEVRGYVDNLEDVYNQASISICPLLSGSGTRLKILEAWHHGLPVVSTSIGIEGITAIPGIHALVADEPTQFANAVISLMQSQSQRQQIGMAAYDMVKANYSAQRIGDLAAYYCWDVINSKTE